jgi:hypothetical protein
MNLMQCENYTVTFSNDKLKIFLDKKNLIKSPEEIEGVIFSVKKCIYDENNVKTNSKNLNFNISISNLNNKVLSILNKTNEAIIVVSENEKLLYLLEAKVT